MPRDINGNTQPLPGTIVSTGDTILPSQHNPMVNDVYAMITQSLSRDGQGGMRANLDMSGFRILNVGAAQNDSDPVTLSQLKLACPVGKVDDYAGSSPPATWMFCYGQAISRSTYADLFSAIGTNYGAGDGSTTFNLPDLRGRVIAGRDNMGGVDSGRLSSTFGDFARVLNGAFGAAVHLLTTGQMPSHTHGVNDPGHSHGAGYAIAALAGSNAKAPSALLDNVDQTQVIGTGISIQSTGGFEAHNNTQPTMIMNKIIKVSY